METETTLSHLARASTHARTYSHTRSAEESARDLACRYKTIVIRVIAVKTYGGKGVWCHSFLTLVPYGGEWSASRSGRCSQVPIEYKYGRAKKQVWTLSDAVQQMF